VHLGIDAVEYALQHPHKLEKVSVVRVSKAGRVYEQPLVEWPQALRRRVLDRVFPVRGGVEIDGRRAAELDEGQVRRVAERLRGARNVVVSSPFSPVYPEDELKVQQLLSSELGQGVRVVASHQVVADMGFAYRENSAILNASMAESAAEILNEVEVGLANLGVSAPVFTLLNSGLQLPAEVLRQLPILSSGAGFAATAIGVCSVMKVTEAIVVERTEGDTVIMGAVHGGLVVMRDAVEVDGFRLNVGGPLTYVTRREASEVLKLGHYFFAAVCGEKIFSTLTAEESRELAGRLGKEVVHVDEPAAPAIGAVTAPHGIRLVRVYPPRTSMEEAKRSLSEELKQTGRRLGIEVDGASMSMYEASIATLPADSKRLLGVLQVSP